jgi:phage repressor protein C with HTH and peptisase S24 domain
VSTDTGERRVVEEEEAEPYYFRKSWLKSRLNSDAEHLRLVRIEGDSMDPTLCHGDVVLVDITRKDPSPPGIFIIFDGMGLVAKRMEFLAQSKPPAVRVSSDNPQYYPYERELDAISVVGRVVWFAREI